MSRNLRGLSARKGLDRNLYTETQQATQPDGGRSIADIAAEFLVGEASLIGASASYDFPQLERSGKKALLCAGTACLVSGRQASLQAALSPQFSDHEIGHVTCLGQCHRNDAFLYDQATWTREDLALLGKPGASPSAPKPVPTGTLATPPILLAPIPNLQVYYAPLLGLKGAPAPALEAIRASGLRGRGGAGFPFHLKVEAARAAVSDQKYVVCNADEGDPGAYSDKWLLEERPHAVLAGMMTSGYQGSHRRIGCHGYPGG